MDFYKMTKKMLMQKTNISIDENVHAKDKYSLQLTSFLCNNMIIDNKTWQGEKYDKRRDIKEKQGREYGSGYGRL